VQIDGKRLGANDSIETQFGHSASGWPTCLGQVLDNNPFGLKITDDFRLMGILESQDRIAYTAVKAEVEPPVASVPLAIDLRQRRSNKPPSSQTYFHFSTLKGRPRKPQDLSGRLA